MKKNVKWVGFGESDEDEKLDPETPEAIHKAEMEDGGYTIVKEGDENMVSKKSKVADGVNTTMLGISQEEAERIYANTLKRGRFIAGYEPDEMEGEMDPKTKRQKLDLARTGECFYQHDIKSIKKQELENLQENFEAIKRQLAKKME